MTQKEKAKELFDKFNGLENMLTSHELECSYIDCNVAKQCALIAVDEIIDTFILLPDIRRSSVEYWEQVKTEIEELYI